MTTFISEQNSTRDFHGVSIKKRSFTTSCERQDFQFLQSIGFRMGVFFAMTLAAVLVIWFVLKYLTHTSFNFSNSSRSSCIRSVLMFACLKEGDRFTSVMQRVQERNSEFETVMLMASQYASNIQSISPATDNLATQLPAMAATVGVQILTAPQRVGSDLVFVFDIDVHAGNYLLPISILGFDITWVG